MLLIGAICILSVSSVVKVEFLKSQTLTSRLYGNTPFLYGALFY